MAADVGRTRALMEHLVAAFEAYVSDHETPYVDAFMGAHNFHKAILFDLISRAAESPEHRRFMLQAARDTWIQAIEAELKKAGD